jgi:hypothetical protein
MSHGLTKDVTKTFEMREPLTNERNKTNYGVAVSKPGFIAREEIKLNGSDSFLPVQDSACGKDGMEARLRAGNFRNKVKLNGITDYAAKKRN